MAIRGVEASRDLPFAAAVLKSPERKGLSRMLAVMLGVAAAVCWSLHDLVARSFAERIGPFRMAAWVMVSGAILLLPYIVWHGTIWQAPPRAILDGLLLGFAYGLAVGGLFKAFSLGPISLVAPVTAGYPMLVVLWGVLHGLQPDLLQWMAVAGTIIGAVVVARSGSADGGINAVAPGKLPLLFVFCALAAAGYSASIVLGQSAALTVGEVEATWLSRATALLALVPFILSEGRRPPLQGRHWLGIVAMGALDVVGVASVNASGHLPGKEFAAVGVSSYGAVAVVLAVLVLREKVSPGQCLGIAMIVAGVATLSLSQ